MWPPFLLLPSSFPPVCPASHVLCPYLTPLLTVICVYFFFGIIFVVTCWAFTCFVAPFMFYISIISVNVDHFCPYVLTSSPNPPRFPCMYPTRQCVNCYQRWRRAYRMNRWLKEWQGRPFPKWTTFSTDSSAWRCNFLKTLRLQGIMWAGTEEWNEWSRSYWWTCTCTCIWCIGKYRATEKTNGLRLQLLGLWQCETKEAQIYIFFFFL